MQRAPERHGPAAGPAAAPLLPALDEEPGSEAERNLLAAIVESSDDAIISKDLDGIVRSWNRGAERTFGYTAEEAIGRPLLELIFPQGFEREEHDILRRVRQGERLDHYETTRRRKDGSLLEVSVTISPVRDAHGRIAAVSKVARDITAQKESTERLRALLHQSPVSTQIVARDGSTIEANPAFYELWGITPDVIRDYNLLRDPQLERKGILPYIERAFAGEVVEVPPVRYDPAEIGKPGRARWVQAVVYPVKGPRGEVHEIVIQHEDITERRTAEDDLRVANERLREADEARTRLVNMAAHELKTPMTPLKLQVTLLRAWAANFTPQQLKALDILERNLNRLDRLVDDVLDAVRFQTGRLRLDLRPIDLNHVVADAVEAFSTAARESGVALESAPGPPMPVRGDTHRLAQVMFNLLANALKFTPAGGTIRVAALPQGSEAVVRVQDTGFGLDAHDMRSLFEPFASGDHAREGSRTGSGLGLYISKGIVEHHGGRIAAESPGRGRGATFTFALPLLEGPAPARAARPVLPLAERTLAERLREGL